MPFSSLSAGQRVVITLELRGGPQYNAQMKAAAANTATLGKVTATTDTAMQKASQRTWLQNQALFTLRRYAFYGTLAITALGVAAVKSGYQYLAAMQTARVALQPVIKNTATLNNYLNQLFQISKYSPFVITDMAIAFRQMYAGLHAVGIGGQQVITTLKELTDIMSYTGKVTPANLNRVSFAMQHLAYSGRLTGMLVRQLYTNGIPIYTILNRYLGVTQDQLSKIASLNIPASKVLSAIHQYATTDAGVKNAALRISMRTLPGLLQVARDTISQLTGGLLSGAYHGGQSGLGRILGPNSTLNRAATIANKKGPGGGATAAIMELSKGISGSTGLGKGFLLLLQTLKNVAEVFTKLLIPAFVIALHTLILFWPILKAVNLIMTFMIAHATALKWVFAALAAEFVITHTAMAGAWLGMRLFTLATFGSIANTKMLIGVFKQLRTVELVGLIAGWKKWAFALTTVSRVPAWKTVSGNMRYMQDFTNKGILAKLSRGIFGVAAAIQAAAVSSWELTAAWLVNPITGIIVAVLALTAGLVVLYFKWKAFHDIVNETFNFLWTKTPLIKLALQGLFGPIFAAAMAVKYIVDHLHSLTHPSLKGALGLGLDVLSPFGPLVNFGLRHLATGGPALAGHSYVIGEQGRELFTPTVSGIVSPIPSPNPIALPVGGSSGGGQSPIVVQLVVDRQVLAEQVARANQDKRARR